MVKILKSKKVEIAGHGGTHDGTLETEAGGSLNSRTVRATQETLS